MISRCYNINSHNYKNYGGRGIIVCEEWKYSMESFVKWGLNNGWKNGLIFDRKDNNNNYFPENCRFVSLSISNKNKRYPAHRDKSSDLPVGVFHGKDGLYISSAHLDGKQINLGTFPTIQEASRTYESVKKLINSKDCIYIIYLTLLAFIKNSNLYKKNENKRRFFKIKRKYNLPHGVYYSCCENQLPYRSQIQYTKNKYFSLGYFNSIEEAEDEFKSITKFIEDNNYKKYLYYSCLLELKQNPEKYKNILID